LGQGTTERQAPCDPFSRLTGWTFGGAGLGTSIVDYATAINGAVSAWVLAPANTPSAAHQAVAQTRE